MALHGPDQPGRPPKAQSRGRPGQGVRLTWVVLAIALAAPAALAAASCEAGQPCSVEVTIDPSGTLSLAQPDIAAGTPLVLSVTNQADRTVNVTLDGTPLRVMAH